MTSISWRYTQHPAAHLPSLPSFMSSANLDAMTTERENTSLPSRSKAMTSNTIQSIDSTATILYSTPHFSGRIAYLPGVEHEIRFAVVEALLLLF